MDFWSVLLDNFEAALLIFARVLGIFTFNPLLSRKNIPAMLRIGISMVLTYILSMSMDTSSVDVGDTMGQYIMCMFREIFVGFVLGFVCSLFIFMLYVAGDIMDAQSGLGMAKVFDPSTSIQMSMFGSYIGFMMYLYFFVSNSHITFIRIFMDTFEVIPLAQGYVDADIGWKLIQMFMHLFVMMMQLAMPVIAAEMIVEICVGVMMKAVPQIQIMVVNIQLKVVVGYFMLLAIAAPLSSFIEKYTENMLNTCIEILPMIMR